MKYELKKVELLIENELFGNIYWNNILEKVPSWNKRSELINKCKRVEIDKAKMNFNFIGNGIFSFSLRYNELVSAVFITYIKNDNVNDEMFYTLTTYEKLNNNSYLLYFELDIYSYIGLFAKDVIVKRISNISECIENDIPDITRIIEDSPKDYISYEPKSKILNNIKNIHSPRENLNFSKVIVRGKELNNKIQSEYILNKNEETSMMCGVFISKLNKYQYVIIPHFGKIKNTFSRTGESDYTITLSINDMYFDYYEKNKQYFIGNYYLPKIVLDTGDFYKEEIHPENDIYLSGVEYIPKEDAYFYGYHTYEKNKLISFSENLDPYIENYWDYTDLKKDFNIENRINGVKIWNNLVPVLPDLGEKEKDIKFWLIFSNGFYINFSNYIISFGGQLPSKSDKYQEYIFQNANQIATSINTNIANQLVSGVLGGIGMIAGIATAAFGGGAGIGAGITAGGFNSFTSGLIRGELKKQEINAKLEDMKFSLGGSVNLASVDDIKWYNITLEHLIVKPLLNEKTKNKINDIIYFKGAPTYKKIDFQSSSLKGIIKIDENYIINYGFQHSYRLIFTEDDRERIKARMYKDFIVEGDFYENVK